MGSLFEAVCEQLFRSQNVANIEALCSQKLSRCLICPDSDIMYDKWTSLCAYLGRTVSKSVCF